MGAYIKRSERSQINYLMLQANSKASRRREMINIRVEINEIERKNKNVQRINETESWFFEKINKIDRFLAKLTKLRREKTQISKIKMQKWR
jgi:hypothetical protein